MVDAGLAIERKAQTFTGRDIDGEILLTIARRKRAGNGAPDRGLPHGDGHRSKRDEIVGLDGFARLIPDVRANEDVVVSGQQSRDIDGL